MKIISKKEFLEKCDIYNIEVNKEQFIKCKADYEFVKNYLLSK